MKLKQFDGLLVVDNTLDPQQIEQFSGEFLLNCKITYIHALSPLKPELISTLRKCKMHYSNKEPSDSYDFTISSLLSKAKNTICFSTQQFPEQITESVVKVTCGDIIGHVYIKKGTSLQEYKQLIYKTEFNCILKGLKELLGITSYNTKDILNINDYSIIRQTDKLYLFDNYICDIPNKGNILTEINKYSFNLTKWIIPNHFIYSQGNVTIAKKTIPISIEFVVRGYLTGSLYQKYTQGIRNFSFGSLPNGMKKDQKLPYLAITLLQKGDYFTTEMSKEDAMEYPLDYIFQKIHELFTFGQYYSKQNGLVLVNTKYEFGFDPLTNTLLLIDDLHTIDNSRFWNTFKSNQEITMSTDSYESGIQWSIKDKIREHLTEIPYKVFNYYNVITGKLMDPQMADSSNSFCYSEKDPIFNIPLDNLIDSSVLYQEFYRKLTGNVFEESKMSFCKIVNNYFEYHANKVIIITETNNVTELNLNCIVERVTIQNTKKLLNQLEKIQMNQKCKYLFLVISRNLTLPEIVASNVTDLVITTIPGSELKNVIYITESQIETFCKKYLN